MAYYFLNNYKNAIEDATKGIDLNPDEPGHFNVRGWSYYGLEYKKAVEDATKAIDLNSDGPDEKKDHFRLRGWSYYGLENYKKAVEDANKLIDLQPDEPESYDLRISVNSNISYEGYINDIKTQDGLRRIKNYLNEADRYYEESRIIEAIDYYEKVLSKSNSEIKEILGNGVMIRINNRILEYRKMINS